MSQSQEAENQSEMELVILPDPVDVPTLAAKPRPICSTSQHTNSGASCRWYRFPVKLHPDRDEWIEVAGELATRQPLTQDTTIQVLLAGGSNNGSYWDWPLEPEKQSYVRHATLVES